MNKKAGTFLVISWIVAVFVVIFFLAAYLYAHNLMTEKLLEAGALIDSNVVNLTDATQKVVVPINSAMSALTWISFVMLVTLAFSTLVENYYIREHPVLIFFHIIVVVIGIIAAIYISNAYENFLTGGILSTTLMQFTASSYIALYLPLWVAVIGIFGLILLVINATRDPALSVKGGI